VAKTFDIPFLFMSYYNIIFKRGVDRFCADMAEQGLKGAIVPDLPHEEAHGYLEAMNENSLSPVFIFSPTTSDERMKTISSFSSGFIYCVARKGVTGFDTNFSDHLDHYIKRCRAATSLPLAIGFGVKNRKDIDFIRGKADIAVIGTQSIILMERQGPEAVASFIRGLR